MEQFNLDALKWWCTATDAEVFERFAKHAHDKHKYIYINNDANVLAVAHVDTVSSYDKNYKSHFYTMVLDGYPYVFSKWLDDRLGCYIITELLPLLGVKVDLLLTTGEETGQSTGADFIPPNDKTYNWMVEFDRHGDDVACYQYLENDEWRNALKLVKAYPVRGTFTDITAMEHLGVCGANFAVGYENEHSHMCHVDLVVMFEQIKRFLKFYDLFKTNKFEYTPPPPVSTWRVNETILENWRTSKRWQELEPEPMTNEEDEYVFFCPGCLNDVIETEFNFNHGLCQACINRKGLD